MRELAVGEIAFRSTFGERLHSSAPESGAIRRAQAMAAFCLYGFFNGTLALAARLRWPGSRPLEAERVCVFRIGNIGDVACALPALRAVREAYPNAHLTLLTSPGKPGMPGAKELLGGATWIDEIIRYHAGDVATFRQRLDLLLKLRARRFDVWLELPQNLSAPTRQFRDMFFTSLVGPVWARGWRAQTLRVWTQAQSEYLDFPGEVDRLSRIASAAGFPAPLDAFGIPRTREVQGAVDGVLDWPTDRRIAAIAPAGKRATNAWPLERFAEVGSRLAAEGYDVVLLGGASDAANCGIVAGMIGPKARNLAGRLSLAESCEVLRRCRLLICVDSGVQHLAAAVGTPCVALFAFWQFIGKWRPYGTMNTVIQKWVPCHTCFLEQCPRENACMNEITVAEVVDAVRCLPGTPASAEQVARNR